jgi:hypothetical protein
MSTLNTPPLGAGPMEEPTPEEIMSALFANMVIQNHNMAAMFLGKAPHPQTGELIKDLDSAQMFVDQLEMIAYKTRGNLNNEEKQLLHQSLTQLRMVFIEELRRSGMPVPEHLSEAAFGGGPKGQISGLGPGAPAESVSAAAGATTATTSSSTSSEGASGAAPAPAQPAAPAPTAPAEDESRKRFTKKY